MFFMEIGGVGHLRVKGGDYGDTVGGRGFG